MLGESGAAGFYFEVSSLVQMIVSTVLELLSLLDILQDTFRISKWNAIFFKLLPQSIFAALLICYPSHTFCCWSSSSVRCGSGLSGDYLSEEGHYWVGVDISTAMLGWFNNDTHIKALIG